MNLPRPIGWRSSCVALPLLSLPLLALLCSIPSAARAQRGAASGDRLPASADDAAADPAPSAEETSPEAVGGEEESVAGDASVPPDAGATSEATGDAEASDSARPSASGGDEVGESPRLRPPSLDPMLGIEASAEPAPTPTPTEEPKEPPKKENAPPTSDPTVLQRWSAPQPVFSLDGYFRVRAEWQKNFYLRRRPIDGDTATGSDLPFSRYRPLEDKRTPDGGCNGGAAVLDPSMRQACATQALKFANMRLRLAPTLALSDDVRVHMMVDVFDNLVLGSTPDTTLFVPSGDGLDRASGVTSLSSAGSAAPPSTYRNSLQDSILVRRAWAEVGRAGIGQLRFGRMGWNFGLGIFANDGSGIDGDFSTDVDRIMAASEFRDFHFALMMDFPNEGFIQQPTLDPAGLAYDAGNKDDRSQYAMAVAYRQTEDEQQQRLRAGKTVINAGLQLIYRSQFLSSAGITSALADNTTIQDSQLFRQKMWAVTPDLWVKLLWRKLRIELETVFNLGGVDDINDSIALNRNYKLVQFGSALESEYRLLDDKLGIYFYTGYASGDRDVNGLSIYEDLETQLNSNNHISTFGFHRNYRIDLILWRNIMGRIAGAYYFKPGVSYDFIRSAFGRLLGARADLVWSRAAQAVQTYGSAADLGVELDMSAYFRSEAGPAFLDGFYAMFQYGVLFPLKGLGYPSVGGTGVFPEGNPRLGNAQTVRLVLGVQF